MPNSQFYIRMTINTYLLHKNEMYWNDLIKNLEEKLQTTKSELTDEKSSLDISKILNKLKEDFAYFNKKVYGEGADEKPQTFEEQLSIAESFFTFLKSYLNQESQNLKQQNPMTVETKELINFLSEENNKIRHIMTSKGMCNGLAAWWEYTFSEGNEETFYKVTDSIADCVKNGKVDDGEIEKQEIEIEKLLAHIKWLHSPEQVDTLISQEDLDVLLEVDREYYIKGFQNGQDFTEAVKCLPANEMMHITGSNHAISAFRKDNIIYLYDSNYKSGRPCKFLFPQELDNFTNEVNQCLFKNFGKAVNFQGVHVGVFTNPMAKQRLDSKDASDHTAQKIKLIQYLTNVEAKADLKRPKKKNKSQLQIVAETLTPRSLEELEQLVGKERSELMEQMNKDNILKYAFDNRNFGFVEFYLKNESALPISQEAKNNLLQRVIQEINSPSIFFKINPNQLENITKLLLQAGADPNLTLTHYKNMPILFFAYQTQTHWLFDALLNCENINLNEYYRGKKIQDMICDNKDIRSAIPFAQSRENQSPAPFSPLFQQRMTRINPLDFLAKGYDGNTLAANFMIDRLQENTLNARKVLGRICSLITIGLKTHREDITNINAQKAIKYLAIKCNENKALARNFETLLKESEDTKISIGDSFSNPLDKMLQASALRLISDHQKAVLRDQPRP